MLIQIIIAILGLIFIGLICYLVRQVKREQIPEKKPEIDEDFKKTHSGTWFDNKPI